MKADAFVNDRNMPSARLRSWSFMVLGLGAGAIVGLLGGRLSVLPAAAAFAGLSLVLLWFRRERRRHAFIALWGGVVVAFVLTGLITFDAAGALAAPVLVLLILLYSLALLLGAVSQALLEGGLAQLRRRARAWSAALPDGETDVTSGAPAAPHPDSLP